MKAERSKSTGSEGCRKAYPIALRLLASRDYTVAGITGKLLLRGCATEDVQAAVSRLQQERFLDDRRYAERFIESAASSGRYVGYRLRQELRRRGVAVELIEDILGGRRNAADDEYELACALVARRYAPFRAAAADDRERRRVAGFLQRRGFGSGTIRAVLLNRSGEVDHDW